VTASVVIDQDDWKRAEGMTLRCTAESVYAVGLVEGLLTGLRFPKAEKPDRPSTVERRRKALRALMADLLRLEAKGLAGFHGMARKDFPLRVLGFGYDVFAPLKDVMVSAGLLEFHPGRPRWNTFDAYQAGAKGDIVQSGGWQARFRLTPKALEEVTAAGIALDAWREHWAPPGELQSASPEMSPTTPLIALRATKERRGSVKPKGRDVPFDMAAPALQSVLADLREHNDFMSAVGVSGVDFIGLRRIFNNGDDAEHHWRHGGRFYSLRGPGMGKAYETLSGDKRRTRIKLGGEAVGEVDMAASQLRILYAVLDEQLPAGPSSDLYRLPCVDREVVKLIVTQAIGKEGVSSNRWGPEAVKEYRKLHDGRSLQEDHPFSVSLAATVAEHPILKRLGRTGVPTSLELQYIESEVVRRAMAELRLIGVPSLPVHDSLIVPKGKLENAAQFLQDAFQIEIGSLLGYPTKILPVVSIKGA